MRASSDHLFQAAGALDAETIRGPAYPSEWTIADVLSHLGSSAVIFAARFDAAVAGREFDGDQQAIWDEWNAKSPDAQVADALAADRALLDRIDALPDAARPDFRFAMGPMEFDFDGFIGLRLNESVLHTWDVAVALDPQATLLAETVPFVVDRVGLIARFTGQPSDIGTVRVRTDDPRRDLMLELGYRRVDRRGRRRRDRPISSSRRRRSSGWSTDASTPTTPPT